MGLKQWIKGMLGATFQLNDNDIVVFLVGPSGSGKSVFLNDVTKSGVAVVGTSLRPSTTAPQAIKCELTEDARNQLGVSSIQKHIVFVDTPSFHTTGRGDGAEKETSNWLKQLKFKATHTGTIYMHRIETDPNNEPMQPHLNTFAGTLPQSVISYGPPERLHAVLSYEDNICEEKIKRHRVALEGQLQALRTRIIHGKVLEWHATLNPDLYRPGDSEAAWNAVVKLFTTAR